MFFRDVRHQDRALSILRRTLKCARTHHAYLFDGPEGVGKERAAEALATKLLCENVPGAAGFQAGLGLAFDDPSETADFEPCGDCRSCRLLAAGNHPDFHRVDRLLHRQHPESRVRRIKGLALVVDVVRHFLIEPASRTPALGRQRVFIVRDAERMNEEASNALLKTLEEPPGAATLVLVTSAASRLLPTIRSRCQTIPFNLLPASFIVERLLAAGVAAENAQTYAALGQGSLGGAMQLQRIAAIELIEPLVALLAESAFLRPEPFSKALIDLGSSVAKRIAAAEKAAQADASEDEADEAEPNNAAADTADATDDPESAASGKAIATDALRSALRFVLQWVAAAYRDAGVAAAIAAANSRAAPDALRMLPKRLTLALSARSPRDDECGDAIRAVAETERLIDRNVAPQLACERLALALSGACLV